MSRIRLQDEDDHDDDYGDYLAYGASLRAGAGGGGGGSRYKDNNPMQSLADELDELTRSLSLGEEGLPSRRTASHSNTGGHNNNNPLPSFGSLQYSSVDSVAASVDHHRQHQHQHQQQRDTQAFTRTRQNLNQYLQAEAEDEEEEEEEEAVPSRARADPPTTTGATTRREPRRSRGFQDEDSSFVTPTEQPMYESQHRSSVNRTRDSSFAAASAAQTTPMEQPPVNLQSPPFRMFSPPIEHEQPPPPSSNRRSASTRKMAPPPPPREEARPQLFPEQPPPSPTPPSSWQPILEDMRHTLEEKDTRIQRLEEENALLRSQLLRLNNQRQHHHETTTAPSRQTPQSSSGTRRHQHYPTNSSSSDPRSRRRRQGTREHEDGMFSPGTKFVAELAQLTEIEVGHYAPLSYIIDKHWDKLAPYENEEEDAY